MNKRQKLTLIFSIQLVLVSSLFLINIYDQIKINPVLAKKLDYPLVKTVVKNIDQTSQKFDNVLSKPSTVKKQMAIINSDIVKQVKENTQEKSLPLEDKIVISPVIMENQPISLTNTSYENSTKDIVSKLDIWDAQITSVNPSNTSPYIDDTISINLTVKNTSNQLASFKYVVKVVDSSNNQKFYDYSTIYDIPVNNSRSKTFSWKVNLVGNFRILAEVWDPGWREKFDSYSSSTYTSRTRPFINPSISRDNSYINPSTIKQGGSFTAYFNVNNQNSNQIKIGLGVTIRNKNTQVEYYDVSHDTTVWINSGTSTQSRLFKVPDNIPVGDYEYVFAIWSELPPNGTWFGSTGWKSPLAIQANFQNPTINDHYISPTTINKNETFNIYYYVYNPNSSNINVGLGASIRKIGVYNDGLSDPNNDRIVTIPSGYSWQSRSFRVPSETQSGANEYIIKLWSSTPGSSSEYAKTNWTSGPTIPQAKGSLTATIKNVGSVPQTIPGSDGLVKLYTISGDYVTEKTTTNVNGNGAVTFDSLTPGDYYIKAYYQKGPWGAEYWGQSSNQTAPEGGSTIFEFTRNNPYMTDINFYRGDTESKVDVNSTLMEGDKVRAEVDIYNATNSDLNLTHTLLLDQSQSSSYDFEENKTVLVNANSSKRLTYYIYPQKISIYYRAMRLQLNDGSITDGWSWHEAIKITAFPPVYNGSFLPTPYDGATKVPNIVDLKWDGAFTDPENKPMTYDLYFGKDKNDLTKTDLGSATTYQLSKLDAATQYWWQVNAKDSQGLSTSGPLWHFTTDRIIPPIIPQENISAGEDKTFLSGMMGTLTATVNDPYFRTLDYQWTEAYTTLAFGQTLNYIFPVGEHNVILHVLVNGEEVGSDTVKVTVISSDAIRITEISYVGRSINNSGLLAPKMTEPLRIMSGITETYRISLINITNNDVEIVPNAVIPPDAGIVTRIYDEWGQTVENSWKIKISAQSIANFRITIKALSTPSVPYDTGTYLEILKKSNNTVIGEKYLQVKLVSDEEWFNQDLELAGAQVGAIYDYLIGDDIRDALNDELPAWRRSLSVGFIAGNFVGIGEIKLIIKTIGKNGLQVTSKEMSRKEIQDAIRRTSHTAKKQMLEETFVDAANRHVYASTMSKEASYNAFVHYGDDSLVLIERLHSSNKIKKSTLATFINRFKNADDMVKKNLLTSLDNLAANGAITQDSLQAIVEKLNQNSLEILGRNAHDADAVNAIGKMLNSNRLNVETIDSIVLRLANDPKVYGLDAIKSIEKLTQKEVFNDWRFIEYLTRRFSAKPLAIESVEKISSKITAQSDITDAMFKEFVGNPFLPDSKLADLLITTNSLRTPEGEFIKGVINRNNGDSFIKDVMYRGVRDINNPDPLIRYPGLANSYFTRATYKASMTSEFIQEGKKLYSFHQHVVLPNPKDSSKPIRAVLDAQFINNKGLLDHYAFIDKTVAGQTKYFTEKTLVPYTGEIIDDFKQVDKIFDLYGETTISARQYTQEFDAYANLLKNGNFANSVWVVEDATDSALEVFKNRWGATIVGQSGAKRYLQPLAVAVASKSLVKTVVVQLDKYVYGENNLIINGVDVSGSHYVVVNGSTDNVQYDLTTGVFSAQVNLVQGTNTITVESEDINGHKSDPTTLEVTYDPTAPEVYANHAAGTFDQPVEVTLRTNENATIYYTLDGSEPTTSSMIYANPININQTTTIKYFAVDEAGNVSATQVDEYIITIPVPQAPKITDYQADSNQQKQLIKGTKDANSSLIMVQEGVNIRHEILPLGLETNWQYQIDHTFEGTNRYLFYSVNYQSKQSDITVIQINRDTQAPVASADPKGGLYNTDQSVKLTSSDQTATIYYQYFADGTVNIEDQPFVPYQSPILVNKNGGKLKYYAEDQAGNRSNITEEIYSINRTIPQSPIIRQYASLTNQNKQIIIGTKEKGTSIRFSLDDNSVNKDILPRDEKEIWEYEVDIQKEGSNRLQFFAVNEVGNQSQPATIYITLDTRGPVIIPSIPSGSYDKVQWVNLNSNENAKIYYSLDGNNPTKNSKQYKRSIRIDKNTTLKILAEDDLGNKADIYQANYQINLGEFQVLNLIEGTWKMVSVASQTTDLEGTFGEEQEIYQYNHQTAKYQKITDKLKSDQAYWIKVKENQTIHIPIDDFNADNFPPASYNQGFAMISGELLKYTKNLRLNDGIDTKTLSEAVEAGWLKSNAYYYEDNSYKVMDLRSITNNDVAGRSFWLRLYRPITFSFDGSWKASAYLMTSDIPKIN